MITEKNKVDLKEIFNNPPNSESPMLVPFRGLYESLMEDFVTLFDENATNWISGFIKSVNADYYLNIVECVGTFKSSSFPTGKVCIKTLKGDLFIGYIKSFSCDLDTVTLSIYLTNILRAEFASNYKIQMNISNDPKSCTCPLNELMAYGCKCGGN